MNIRLAAMVAVAGATAVAATVSLHRPATAQDGSTRLPAVQSAGPVLVNPDQPALIGLLLPAVQKVRSAAAMAFFVDGKRVAVDPVGDPAAGESALSPRWRLEVERTGDGSVLVVRRAGAREPVFRSEPNALGEQFDVSTVFLPAVQINGRTVGALSGSIQILMGDGSVRGILPYIEQDNL